MNFPQLREAFEDDKEELRDFSEILIRELRMAAEQLDRAVADHDAQTVADLRHKLRTSLSLSGAYRVRDAIEYIHGKLQAQQTIPAGAREALSTDFNNLIHSLQQENW